MKVTRLATLCFSIVGLGVSSGTALAGWGENAILNGGTIQWAGAAANVNVITVNGLSAYMWNNHNSASVDVEYPGMVITTRGNGGNPANFCDDTKGPDQLLGQHPNTAYYAYLAAYATADNPTLYAVVISTTPPDSEGRPHTPGIGFSLDNGFYVETKDFEALFLGSYVTDANSNMIPFERHGEEVFLAPATAQPVPFQKITFDAAYNNGNYPAAQNLVFPNVIPVTAAALILDLQVVSTTAASDVFVLDSTLNGVQAAGGACSVYSQLDIVAPAGNVAATTTTLRRVRVRTLQGDNAITTGVCTKPAAGKLIVDGSVTGYVEPVHHLAMGNAN